MLSTLVSVLIASFQSVASGICSIMNFFDLLLSAYFASLLTYSSALNIF
jgi:hypothetical protein